MHMQCMVPRGLVRTYRRHRSRRSQGKGKGKSVSESSGIWHGTVAPHLILDTGRNPLFYSPKATLRFLVFPQASMNDDESEGVYAVCVYRKSRRKLQKLMCTFTGRL
jgi:hypothetical protein